jgi:hypothetical protein
MTTLAALALLLGQVYPQPAPTPVGGPIVVVGKNLTITSSGSQVYTNLGATEVDLVYTVGTVSSGTVTFTLSEVDPQNTGTLLTGDTAPVSTGAISGAVTGNLSLAPLHSSAVQVAWTVGGGSPSSSGIYLTLRGAPAPSSGGGGSGGSLGNFVDGGLVVAGNIQLGLLSNDAGCYLLPNGTYFADDVLTAERMAAQMADGTSIEYFRIGTNNSVAGACTGTDLLTCQTPAGCSFSTSLSATNMTAQTVTGITSVSSFGTVQASTGLIGGPTDYGDLPNPCTYGALMSVIDAGASGTAVYLQCDGGDSWIPIASASGPAANLCIEGGCYEAQNLNSLQIAPDGGALVIPWSMDGGAYDGGGLVIVSGNSMTTQTVAPAILVLDQSDGGNGETYEGNYVEVWSDFYQGSLSTIYNPMFSFGRNGIFSVTNAESVGPQAECTGGCVQNTMLGITSDLGGASTGHAILGVMNSEYAPAPDFARFSRFDANGWDLLPSDRAVTIDPTGRIFWGPFDGGAGFSEDGGVVYAVLADGGGAAAVVSGSGSAISNMQITTDSSGNVFFNNMSETGFYFQAGGLQGRITPGGTVGAYGGLYTDGALVGENSGSATQPLNFTHNVTQTGTYSYKFFNDNGSTLIADIRPNGNVDVSGQLDANGVLVNSLGTLGLTGPVTWNYLSPLGYQFEVNTGGGATVGNRLATFYSDQGSTAVFGIQDGGATEAVAYCGNIGAAGNPPLGCHTPATAAAGGSIDTTPSETTCLSSFDGTTRTNALCWVDAGTASATQTVYTVAPQFSVGTPGAVNGITFHTSALGSFPVEAYVDGGGLDFSLLVGGLTAPQGRAMTINGESVETVNIMSQAVALGRYHQECGILNFGSQLSISTSLFFSSGSSAAGTIICTLTAFSGITSTSNLVQSWGADAGTLSASVFSVGAGTQMEQSFCCTGPG